MDFNEICKLVYSHYQGKGFEDNWNSGYPTHFADLAEIALVSSEVGEACEAIREDNLKNLAEELADIVIRIINIAMRKHIDLQNAILHKQKINMRRNRLHNKQA